MTPRTRAFFATLSPALLSGVELPLSSGSGLSSHRFAIASASLLFLSSLAKATPGRVFALSALGLAAFAHRQALVASPMSALLGVLIGTGILWGVLAPDRLGSSAGGAPAVRGACQGTLLFWLALVASGAGSTTSPAWLLSASFAGVLVLAFRPLCLPARVGGSAGPARLWLRRALWALGLLVGASVAADLVGWGVVGPSTLLFAVATTRRAAELENAVGWGVIAEHPHRLLVVTFVALCSVGTIFLALPQSGVGKVDLIDAAFTAVSGVCVTGLSVVDIGTRFTLLGQWLLLLLIQVGGLGIMTFSVLAYSWIGRRMSLRQEKVAEALVGAQGHASLVQATRRILIFTFVVEGLGAVLLSAAFWSTGESLPRSLFHGVFTAVSAFCNAGFSLHVDNLVVHAQRPWVLHVVAVLIVLGGLSPAAVVAIPRLVRPQGSPRLLRFLVPLLVTGILLGAGTLALLALEWNHTLASFGFWDRLHNAWFQSATLRTAGFNSVNFSAMAPATLTFCMIMMFIGGSPGGTAGGIKTTTFWLMVLGVVKAVRGDREIVIFRRQVDEHSRERASVVVSVALAGALAGIMAVQLTQDMPLEMAAFEVVSALGTVGLTIGGTARLDDVGKLIIMACMFVGRVGGLSFLMFFSSRHPHARWSRPVEELDVG